MNLAEFAAHVRRNYPDEPACYVATIANLDDDGVETLHLEVELEPDAVIGGVYDLGVLPDEVGFRQAAIALDALQDKLRKVGFRVYEDQDEWLDTVSGDEED